MNQRRGRGSGVALRSPDLWSYVAGRPQAGLASRRSGDRPHGEPAAGRRGAHLPAPADRAGSPCRVLFRYKGVCARTARRVCAPPSATASVERCRLRGCDHVGDRHHSVLRSVVEAASAAGWNQHSPWTGSRGDRALHTLGEGEARSRDVASTLRDCCYARDLCPCLLGGGAYPPRRTRIASTGRPNRFASGPWGGILHPSNGRPSSAPPGRPVLSARVVSRGARRVLHLKGVVDAGPGFSLSDAVVHTSL